MKASLFISILLIGFVLGNYLSKYKIKNNKKNKTLIYKFILASILQVLFFIGLIKDIYLLRLISAIIFGILIIIELIKMFTDISWLKSINLSNKEIILISLQNLIFLMGAMLLSIEYLIILCLNKIEF